MCFSIITCELQRLLNELNQNCIFLPFIGATYKTLFGIATTTDAFYFGKNQLCIYLFEGKIHRTAV